MQDLLLLGFTPHEGLAAQYSLFLPSPCLCVTYPSVHVYSPIGWLPCTWHRSVMPQPSFLLAHLLTFFLVGRAFPATDYLECRLSLKSLGRIKHAPNRGYRFVSPLPPFSRRGICRFPVPENALFLWEVILFLQNLLYESTVLREAKPGCFQTRVFPTFFGNGPDCVADPFGTVPRWCS